MNIKPFQRKILTYYKENKRDLPWRKTTNPYFILLSEVMLQQTQVSRGLIYYNKWVKKFPTIEKLARAKRTTVLKEWMGLGYNSRAINLHRAAQKIVEEYQSDIIKAMIDFKNIPGIGPYTSHAVRIFSQNEDIATVDTNIRRILIHEFNLNEKVSDKELQEIAVKCLPKGKSKDWHNALMDYGATLLTSRKAGIKPKTKQSKFVGSDRQIRAKIVKYLLKEKQATLKVIERVVCPQQTLVNNPSNRVKDIVDKLIKEEILVMKKSKIALSNK